MKCDFIQIKLKDRNNIKLNKKILLKLFKLSIEDKANNLDYNKNKKISSKQNLEIIYYKNNIKKNIGKILYKVNKDDKEKQIKLFNMEFISNNIKRVRIIINNKQYKLAEYYKNKMNKTFIIKINFLDIIIHLSCMFKDCKSLYSFENFNFNNIKTIKGMFYGCSSLESLPDISKWNTKNINDISYLFFGCSSLLKLPDISSWDLSNVDNCIYLFGECSLLEYLPDISNWNIINIKSLQGLFYKCKSLKKLPDISKWNTSNAFSLFSLFNGCSSLKELPDISEWIVNKVIYLNFLFYNCSSLISLPDISKWKIFNSNIDHYKSYIDSMQYLDEKNRRKIYKSNSFFNEYDLYLENLKNKIFKRKQYKREEVKQFLLNSAYNMNNLFAGCSY